MARAGSVLAVPRREEALVTVDGRAYRGIVEVRHLTGRGLVVVNRLGLEAYLLGVVPAEIGPRRPEEMEAVKAQAVAARTYSLANLGRRDSLGFDMFGSIQDQVYGGVSVERPRVARAVRATAGQVLTYRGRPIRAYYHSTGGGRTAKVTDAWRLPDAPYLRRVEDARPGGGHWCEISPRYRWTERWSPAELDRAVHRGLADYFDADTARLGSVRAIGVRERTPAGRVTRLEVRVEGGRFVVTKNDIRFFLHTPDGRTLRSTHFEIVAAPQEEGGLVLRGRGYGHGIGMCQWGAIGRARAGQSYREILRAYYPGARLVRAY